MFRDFYEIFKHPRITVDDQPYRLNVSVGLKLRRLFYILHTSNTINEYHDFWKTELGYIASVTHIENYSLMCINGGSGNAVANELLIIIEMFKSLSKLLKIKEIMFYNNIAKKIFSVKYIDGTI